MGSKTPFFLPGWLATCVALLALVVTLPALAQDEKPASTGPSEQFVVLYREAAALLRAKKFEESLEKLNEAEKIETNINAVNLRGAIYTEMRDYTKAREYFQQAVNMEPDSFGPRFNLGEVDFLEGKYSEARTLFEKVKEKNQNNELLNYKIYLTYLLQGDMAKAKKMLGEFDFAGELPAYYFANAAWHFANKEPKVGFGWVSSAQSIYPAQANNLFVDSLVEVGWVDPENNNVEIEMAPPTVLPKSEGPPPAELMTESPSLVPSTTKPGTTLPSSGGLQNMPDLPGQ